MKMRQTQRALDAFERVVAIDPANEAANLYAATAAMEMFDGETAVKYAEKAKELAPNDWRVNTTLVAAYAGAGHRQQRDAERELLRKLHDDPHAAEATQTNGFLLEMFLAGPYRVDAIEYFHPMGEFHLYYRFLVRKRSGERIGAIDCQSDDLNQASWAKAHPKDAAAGKRQFSLEGDSGGRHTQLGLFSGDADYDRVKAEVARTIAAQPGLFPAGV